MPTKNRTIPRIDLSNFEERQEEIAQQVWEAATTEGFFVLHNQEFPLKQDIEHAFTLSEAFFGLSQEQKFKTPHIKLKNTGYEYKSQTRPLSSTRVPENKELLQLQYHRINENWPDEPELDQITWREGVQQFMTNVQKLSMLILDIFSEKLGFEKDYLRKCHTIESDTAQSTLRFLHYFDELNDIEGAKVLGAKNKEDDGIVNWRAAPHTDFDCLTLLFCKHHDRGLEYCPGRDVFTDFGYGDDWSAVTPEFGDIVINIGDMLMLWSDNKLKLNFHRVRYVPDKGGDRYSIAWFNQANTDVVIQGPEKTYPPVTGKGFIEDAMKRNFERANLVRNSS